MARMRVFIDGLQPLIWKTTLEFDDGRELVVTLVYEKLHNHSPPAIASVTTKKHALINHQPQLPLEIILSVKPLT